MGLAGLEPASSRLGVDKPRPSARRADMCVARQVLYQLSYRPTRECVCRCMRHQGDGTRIRSQGITTPSSEPLTPPPIDDGESGWHESHVRPLAPEASALLAELHPGDARAMLNALGVSCTRVLLRRREMLCLLSYERVMTLQVQRDDSSVKCRRHDSNVRPPDS